jgi:hypothetical protein
MKPGDIVYRTLYSQYKNPNSTVIYDENRLPYYVHNTVVDLIENKRDAFISPFNDPITLWEGIIVKKGPGLEIIWQKSIGTWANRNWKSILIAFQTLIRF